MTLPKSQSLLNIFFKKSYHVFIWENLCKVPQSYKVRSNLEASYIVLLKPTLYEQKDFEIVTLFRNGVT